MWEMTRGEGARDRKQESSPARLTVYAVTSSDWPASVCSLELLDFSYRHEPPHSCPQSLVSEDLTLEN